MKLPSRRRGSIETAGDVLEMIKASRNISDLRIKSERNGCDLCPHCLCWKLSGDCGLRAESPTATVISCGIALLYLSVYFHLLV